MTSSGLVPRACPRCHLRCTGNFRLLRPPLPPWPLHRLWSRPSDDLTPTCGRLERKPSSAGHGAPSYVDAKGKSKQVNAHKQRLAEVEIARSQNWPKSKTKAGRSRNWPKSKLIGRSRTDGVCSVSSFSLSCFFFCFVFSGCPLMGGSPMSCGRVFPRLNKPSSARNRVPCRGCPSLRCGPLDVLGHHRAACSRAGVLGSRGFSLESAAARVCREAGARVSTNLSMTPVIWRSLRTGFRCSAEPNWQSIPR